MKWTLQNHYTRKTKGNGLLNDLCRKCITTTDLYREIFAELCRWWEIWRLCYPKLAGFMLTALKWQQSFVPWLTSLKRRFWHKGSRPHILPSLLQEHCPKGFTACPCSSLLTISLCSHRSENFPINRGCSRKISTTIMLSFLTTSLHVQ